MPSPACQHQKGRRPSAGRGSKFPRHVYSLNSGSIETPQQREGPVEEGAKSPEFEGYLGGSKNGGSLYTPKLRHSPYPQIGTLHFGMPHIADWEAEIQSRSPKIQVHRPMWTGPQAAKTEHAVPSLPEHAFTKQPVLSQDPKA